MPGYYEDIKPYPGEDGRSFLVVTKDRELALRIAGKTRSLQCLGGTVLYVIMGGLDHDTAAEMALRFNEEHGEGKFTKEAFDSA